MKWSRFMMNPMLIKKIQFDDLRFSPGSGHHAMVILTTETSTMCLRGRAQIPEGAGPLALAEALLSDAMRQVRRLPEFRTGQRAIGICPGALRAFRMSFGDEAPALRRSA